MTPAWSPPDYVRAVSTTRAGGISQGPYAGLNLGMNSGDSEAAVKENRSVLMQILGLSQSPCWLQQAHTANVVEAQQYQGEAADASVTEEPGVVCVIATADCLPVLLCSRTRPWVAAVHVGWRGVAQNILKVAVDTYPGRASELQAWLGPSISAPHYEVDQGVRDQLEATLAEAAMCESDRAGHWKLSLQDAARYQLREQAIVQVDNHAQEAPGETLCTYSDDTRFYSYRRDKKTGRMASLIWIEPGSI